ncbi:MAG: YcxB family protein [Clostridium sp.]
MKITVRYNDSDYMDYVRLINSNNSNLKRGKLLYKLLIPFLIIILTSLMWKYIYPYTLPTLVVGSIFIVLWFVFSNDIYVKQLDKSLLRMIKDQYSKNIEYIKDTTITLNEDNLTKDVEGCHLRFDWTVVDKVFVTENHIFIKLTTATFIMVPLRFFNSKEEQDIFLKFIDAHISSSTGLQI